MYDLLVPRVIAPLYERLSGRRPWTEAARLQALQWQTAEDLAGQVLARLRPLLIHAAEHVPYYQRCFRTAGVTANDVHALADLERLPLATKASLRAAFPSGVLADNLPARRRTQRVTGGSTGAPFPFFADRASTDLRLGCYLLFRQWAGVGARAVRLHIASPVHFQNRPSAIELLLRRLLLGDHVRFIAGTGLTAAQLCAAVRQTAARHPYFLWTYPSYAARIAEDLLAGGPALSRHPDVVICYAETLTERDAALMRHAFRCPVVNLYSSMEVPLMALTCPDDRELLHVNSLRVVLRVVREDGRDALPGQGGRVVVTDLSNYVMPLINYELGDNAVAGPPCRCGRGFPTLRAIDGRSAEAIRTPDGRVVPASTLNGFLIETCGAAALLREYQAVQTAPDAVTLRVVPTAQFTLASAAALEAQLAAFLGPAIHTTVDVVADIPVERSGKRLLIKSHAATSPAPTTAR